MKIIKAVEKLVHLKCFFFLEITCWVVKQAGKLILCSSLALDALTAFVCSERKIRECTLISCKK